MTLPNLQVSLCVRRLEGGPVIETRARAIGAGCPIPEGKVLVVRTPILPPNATEARIRAGVTMQLVDDGEVPSRARRSEPFDRSRGRC